MAENENGQERTEQPTAKRLEDARRKGQVPRSRELNTMTVTLAGAVGVPVSTAVSAIFSEAMDPATITGGSFLLQDAAAVPVTATITYSAAATTATCTPSSALNPATTYTAIVTTAATDTAGNALAAGYSWSFTTPGATTTPPRSWTSHRPSCTGSAGPAST